MVPPVPRGTKRVPSCENRRFQFEINLTILAKVVVSYGSPSLSVVRSVSAAYRVEILVAWRAMMTPPIARRNEDAGEKRAKAVWAT